MLATSQALAEGPETGGGYDYKAAEKAEADAIAKVLTKERVNKQKAKKSRQLKQIANEKSSLLSENLAKLKDADLCVKAGKYHDKSELESILAELKKRRLPYDEESIKNKNVKINGYECDAFAAYGRPERYNRTVSQRGKRVQMVYGSSYIYTEDGVITAWSD